MTNSIQLSQQFHLESWHTGRWNFVLSTPERFVTHQTGSRVIHITYHGDKEVSRQCDRCKVVPEKCKCPKR